MIKNPNRLLVVTCQNSIRLLLSHSLRYHLLDRLLIGSLGMLRLPGGIMGFRSKALSIVIFLTFVITNFTVNCILTLIGIVLPRFRTFKSQLFQPDPDQLPYMLVRGVH